MSNNVSWNIFSVSHDQMVPCAELSLWQFAYACMSSLTAFNTVNGSSTAVMSFSLLVPKVEGKISEQNLMLDTHVEWNVRSYQRVWSIIVWVKPLVTVWLVVPLDKLDFWGCFATGAFFFFNNADLQSKDMPHVLAVSSSCTQSLSDQVHCSAGADSYSTILSVP